MKKIYFTVLLPFLLIISTSAQDTKEKGIYRDKVPTYFNEVILRSADSFLTVPSAPARYFTADLSAEKFPVNPQDYKQYWHNPPLSQGITGTCWCFSTTSFLESELKRMKGIEVKLSEMFPVYWEYVEKAKAFVNTRGETYFDEGSEAIGVLREYKKYGIVPEEAYTGMLKGQKFLDHREMISEMQDYLKTVKDGNAWDEETVVKNYPVHTGSLYGAASYGIPL